MVGSFFFIILAQSSWRRPHSERMVPDSPPNSRLGARSAAVMRAVHSDVSILNQSAGGTGVACSHAHVCDILAPILLNSLKHRYKQKPSAILG